MATGSIVTGSANQRVNVMPTLTASSVRRTTSALRAVEPRTAVLASVDEAFRTRVREALIELRWQVMEAEGGAEAMAYLEACPAEVMIVDTWLPDLEIQEFIHEFERHYPGTDLIAVDDPMQTRGSGRSPRRNEVLLALRRGQDAEAGNQVAARSDGAIWNDAHEIARPVDRSLVYGQEFLAHKGSVQVQQVTQPVAQKNILPNTIRLPELEGESQVMLEVSRRIRLVAPRSTTVLVQGPTGSGKEIVAHLLHRLSPRKSRRMVALNCAAIPESLLEAELFGHTRGAFTGAVQGRVGRIEAADGGTLFLDEIGEMPLALQAKLLRFLETGEVQRIGNNDPTHVDVRIVAATHRSLADMVRAGTFRADLYFRLAVFVIRTPSLDEHREDIPQLANRLLAPVAEQPPVREISDQALEKLMLHRWPGNVRELQHVLERATILSEGGRFISAEDIEFLEEI